MARKAVSHATPPVDTGPGAGSIIPRLMVIITCVAAVGGTVYRLRAPEMPGVAAPPASVEEAPLPTSSLGPSGGSADAEPQPEPSPRATPAPTTSAATIASIDDTSVPVPRVGIVSGHWGSDTGAVCSDGLEEVDVNLAIAVPLLRILESLGYEVDLLQEFDVRLRGYIADVLVSVHADSCEPFPDAVPPMTGFKVASVEDSWVPEEEQRLVACLAHHYATRTGMQYHADTVTFDMTRYHTFYEVDGRTPAAIIETGFLWADRHIVAGQPDLVAQAIAEGIVCFLTGEDVE